LRILDCGLRIEVYPPSCLGGNVQAAAISIKPGGIFNGNCAMKVQTTPSKKPRSHPKFLWFQQTPKANKIFKKS
jgi:cytoskeletal protein CcmA (bactofilin family)